LQVRVDILEMAECNVYKKTKYGVSNNLKQTAAQKEAMKKYKISLLLTVCKLLLDVWMLSF
jgi:hypothetical protein